MTFTASAPGRCGIIGNPSDIYGGSLVSCSVSARATCRLTVGEDHMLPEDTRLWDAAMKRFPLEGPVKVEWSTAVPRSSGLSGSTALLASTLASVLAARGCPPTLDSEEERTNFAELVRDIEFNEAGVKCGYQDAYMICHGGLRLLKFPGKRPDISGGPHGSTEPLHAPLPFLLVTTGVERLSGSVHGPMIDRYLAGDQDVIHAIDRIKQLGLEGAEALVSGDYHRLGELMAENHRLIANLGGSGEAIDKLIGACLRNGAMGAKLAGAGLGGTVIALTEDPAGLEERLREEGYTRFMRPEIQDGVRLE